jgi:hypothetical protein
LKRWISHQRWFLDSAQIALLALPDRQNMFCQACRQLAPFIQISNRNIEFDVR